MVRLKFDWEEFDGRKVRDDVRHVLQYNPGIVVGKGLGHLLRDFGGMPYLDWAEGDPFPAGSEMRQFSCPAWWYQNTAYELKPNWDWCLGCGSFTSCQHFPTKAQCWERWDSEFGKSND